MVKFLDGEGSWRERVGKAARTDGRVEVGGAGEPITNASEAAAEDSDAHRLQD